LDLSYNQLEGTLPENIGNVYYFYVNHNNLDGPIPLSYKEEYPFEAFYFDTTDICEPQDPDFQTWLSSITSLSSSEIPCESTPPTASFSSPIIDGVLMKPRANIVVNASDAGSGMKHVEFYAYYDGAWNLIGTDMDGSDGWSVLFPSYDISETSVSLKAVATDKHGNQTTIQMNDIPLSNTFSFGNGYESRGGEGEKEVEIPKTPYPPGPAPYPILPY